MSLHVADELYEYPTGIKVRPYIWSKFTEHVFDGTQTVYHYTNLTGMLGIIQSQAFWASHISYMNDAEEYKNGIKLCCELIDQRLKTPSLTVQQTLCLTKIKELVSTNIHDTYVVSFTTDGDLLSQWRGYSNNDVGVALGFKLNHLVRHHKKHINGRFFLSKVIYDDTVKRDIVSEVLDIAMQSVLVLSAKWPLNDIGHEVASLIMETVRWFLPLFKHGTFSEEREWRHVHVSYPDSRYIYPTSYRVHGDILLPYIELQLHDLIGPTARLIERPSLPLSFVHVGPSPNSHLTRHSIIHFLSNHGYYNPEVMVQLSDIPFRS